MSGAGGAGIPGPAPPASSTRYNTHINDGATARNGRKTMDKKTYDEAMAKIAEGGKVTKRVFDQLNAFATEKKLKHPAEDAVLAPGEKAKCSVTQEQDPKMATATCGSDSRAGGMCATHYSRLVYRSRADKAEKAREASRNYAAKKRAAKKAAELVTPAAEPAAEAQAS